MTTVYFGTSRNPSPKSRPTNFGKHFSQDGLSNLRFGAAGGNVYSNRGDTAMAISDATKGDPDRLGDGGPRAPFAVPAKVTQIDCSGVVSGLVEHSYFLDEPRVVRDMGQVLEGTDPMGVSRRKFLEDRNRFVITGA